jgi:hypothetical protein
MNSLMTHFNYKAGEKMLKKCMMCHYYDRLFQFDNITLHHYCHYHKITYTLLKLQNKIRFCPKNSIDNKASSTNLVSPNPSSETLATGNEGYYNKI